MINGIELTQPRMAGFKGFLVQEYILFLEEISGRCEIVVEDSCVVSLYRYLEYSCFVILKWIQTWQLGEKGYACTATSNAFVGA